MPLRSSELLDQRAAARTGQCHCKDCQRASGTGHMSLARFRQRRYRHQRPDHVVRIPSRQWQYQHSPFLPNMRQPDLWRELGRPGVVNVSVGCMEDHSWFAPGIVVYAKDRAVWDHPSTSIPNYERMPPSSAAPAKPNHPAVSLCSRSRTGASAGQGRAQLCRGAVYLDEPSQAPVTLA